MKTTKPPSVETVVVNDIAYAIIVRFSHHKNGIEFYTPMKFSQQLGYMHRPPGYTIPPHVHKLHPREVQLTQETLFIRRGRVKVNFYNDKRELITSRILGSGDVILLASGGHGFEFLEESEVIEVKQGPYIQDEDKVRF